MRKRIVMVDAAEEPNATIHDRIDLELVVCPATWIRSTR